jgi:hypothetical protein
MWVVRTTSSSLMSTSALVDHHAPSPSAPGVSFSLLNTRLRVATSMQWIMLTHSSDSLNRSLRLTPMLPCTHHSTTLFSRLMPPITPRHAQPPYHYPARAPTHPRTRVTECAHITSSFRHDRLRARMSLHAANTTQHKYTTHTRFLSQTNAGSTPHCTRHHTHMHTSSPLTHTT